jgi:DNA repair protein RadA/Sms
LSKEDPVRYVCSNCGFSTVTRTGKCASCGQWGTFMAALPAFSGANSGERLRRSRGRVEVVNSVSVVPPARLTSGIAELDRVLGGGLVPGGVVLIGGQPGIGKSTLLLQVGGLVAAG